MSDKHEHRTRIAPLSTIGKFEVAKDFRDPRGWAVLLGDGTKVGKVNELIVDTEALRTRYLEVSLDKKPIGFDHDRNVLVPVGSARLDSDRNHVVLESIELRQLAALPPYDRHELTRDYEHLVMKGFGSTDNTTEFSTTEKDAFYNNRNFDDRNFNNSRRIVQSPNDPVVTESEIRVPITDEKLVIERLPSGTEEIVIRRQPGSGDVRS